MIARKPRRPSSASRDSGPWLDAPSWATYSLAGIVIGVADSALLFTQVTPGFIELDAGTIGGPVLWAAMCVVTPFGLRSLRARGAQQTSGSPQTPAASTSGAA